MSECAALRKPREHTTRGLPLRCRASLLLGLATSPSEAALHTWEPSLSRRYIHSSSKAIFFTRRTYTFIFSLIYLFVAEHARINNAPSPKAKPNQRTGEGERAPRFCVCCEL